MDAQSYWQTLADLTEQDGMLREIASGEIDTASHVVDGDADDVETFLCLLPHIASAAAEHVYNWMKRRATADSVIDGLVELIEDYQYAAQDVTLVSDPLSREVSNLLGLVRGAIEFISQNKYLVEPAPSEYYVYIHIDRRTNTVFYVGKGVDKRAWKRERHSSWRKHVSEIGGDYIVQIVKQGLTEVEALEYEQELLLQYKDTVVNRQKPVGLSIALDYKHA